VITYDIAGAEYTYNGNGLEFQSMMTTEGLVRFTVQSENNPKKFGGLGQFRRDTYI